MFCGRADLEAAMTAVHMVQYLDDDRDGVPDDRALTDVTTEANREIEAMLVQKGFSHEQLVVLAKDEFVRRQAALVAKENAGFRRPTMLLADGTTIFSPEAKRARERIKMIASAELRLNAERAKGAGATGQVRGKANVPEPKFYVAPSSDDPKGPGGF